MRRDYTPRQYDAAAGTLAIEFALHGGRVNTDFVDNSGGVDCSDHEVNIKILLDVVQRRIRQTRAERNRLLKKWDADVGAAPK